MATVTTIELSNIPAHELHIRFSEILHEEIKKIETMLLAKNKDYGSSAIVPINIFANGDAIEQIMVRIDDKLNRIRNLKQTKITPNILEDTEMDLIGYLLILKVVRRLRDSPPSLIR